MGFLQLWNIGSVFALLEEEFQQRRLRDRSHESLGIGNQKAVSLPKRHKRQALGGKDSGNPDHRQGLTLGEFPRHLGRVLLATVCECVKKGRWFVSLAEDGRTS